MEQKRTSPDRKLQGGSPRPLLPHRSPLLFPCLGPLPPHFDRRFLIVSPDSEFPEHAVPADFSLQYLERFFNIIVPDRYFQFCSPLLSPLSRSSFDSPCCGGRRGPPRSRPPDPSGPPAFRGVAHRCRAFLRHDRPPEFLLSPQFDFE